LEVGPGDPRRKGLKAFVLGTMGNRLRWGKTWNEGVKLTWQFPHVGKKSSRLSRIRGE
jgi:hypothetical protein